MQLDPDLSEFLRRRSEAAFRVQFCGWQHSQSRVWQVSLADGGSLHLKAFLDVRKFQHELHFYQHWAAPLPTPELLSYDTKLKVLLLTSVPGAPLLKRNLDSASEARWHTQAGRWLSTLHTLPAEDNDIPLGEAVWRRCQAACRRAESCVEATQIEQVKFKVDEIRPALDGYRRVPCHRDYTPRNWLVDGETLHLIDFEHSRLDLRLLDFEKLFSQVWLDRPELADAFFEGYGRALSDAEASILKRLSALTALSTVAWSVEHKDPEFEALGRCLLTRLL